jgi:quaternary ammonium compound-resistance protein SugE
LVPSIFTGIVMVASFFLLSYSLRTISIGTAYAVWTGIGACGTLLFGMFFLGESRDPIRIGCIIIIVACIFTLKITHK